MKAGTAAASGSTVLQVSTGPYCLVTKRLHLIQSILVCIFLPGAAFNILVHALQLNTPIRQLFRLRLVTSPGYPLAFEPQAGR